MGVGGGGGGLKKGQIQTTLWTVTLSFVATTLSTQPQPLFVFMQSEACSNNKQDKTKSCKHQSHEGIFISKTDKYTVSFFFDDKGLQPSLLN